MQITTEHSVLSAGVLVGFCDVTQSAAKVKCSQQVLSAIFHSLTEILASINLS